METGDQEQRHVALVATSVEVAARVLKTRFQPPYVVAWSEPKEDDYGDWTIEGRFEQVQGYSTAHTARYDLLQMDVHDV